MSEAEVIDWEQMTQMFQERQVSWEQIPRRTTSRFCSTCMSYRFVTLLDFVSDHFPHPWSAILIQEKCVECGTYLPRSNQGSSGSRGSSEGVRANPLLQDNLFSTSKRMSTQSFIDDVDPKMDEDPVNVTRRAN
jgi:hypothetical protein